MFDWSKIWSYKLTAGFSANPRHGACVMQAIDWLEYGGMTDTPKCVCHVIRRVAIAINDCLNDNERQALKNYIPRLVGSTDAHNVMRHRAIAGLEVLYADGGIVSHYGASLSEVHGLIRTGDIHDAAERMGNIIYNSRYNFPNFFSVETCFRVLDAMLAIGKQAEPIDMAKAETAIKAFAVARGEKVEA
jgi:hypothetical protein